MNRDKITKAFLLLVTGITLLFLAGLMIYMFKLMLDDHGFTIDNIAALFFLLAALFVEFQIFKDVIGD